MKMNKQISKLPSPVLAGVIREKTVEASIAEIQNCFYNGAGMIDLHMSCLDKHDVASLERIVKSTELPVLALNYNIFTETPFTEEERAESFLRAVDAGAAGIDMQGYTYHLPSKDKFCGEDKYSFTKASPKEVVTDEKVIAMQCELIEKVHGKGAEVLLSCHPGVCLDCEQVVDLALFLEKRNPDIIKIVSVAQTEEHLLESMNAMMKLKKEVKTPVSYHASGSAGKLSRIVNPMLGGHMIFCVDRYNERSTLEQPELRAVKQVVDNLRKMV